MVRRFMLVAMLATAPAVAHAQLGKLVKQKAKEKATEQIAGKPAEKVAGRQAKQTYHADRYTEATIGGELDEKTFDAALRGMRAVQNEFAGVQAERTRLWAREKELLPTAIRLDSAWRERRERAEQCQKDFMNTLMEKRQSELTARAAMPSMDQKTLMLTMSLTDSATQAAQRGDTVEVERLNRRLMKITYGIDVAADSVAAVKKCGAIPERPAAALEVERIRASVDSLMTLERQIQERTVAKAAEVSGLPRQQFALARERILTWYADQSGGEGDLSRWSRREHEMFERRRDEIRQALGLIE